MLISLGIPIHSLLTKKLPIIANNKMFIFAINFIVAIFAPFCSEIVF